MNQNYEKKDISEGCFKKSFNYKPITTLNNSNLSSVKQPKQPSNNSSQSNVEKSGGGNN